jgi:hypothetical protein
LDAAEDITQECFLRLMRRPAFDHSRGSLRQYLYGIVRNLVRQHQQANGREVHWDEDADDDQSPAVTAPLDLMASAELTAVVQAAICRGRGGGRGYRQVAPPSSAGGAAPQPRTLPEPRADASTKRNYSMSPLNDDELNSLLEQAKKKQVEGGARALDRVRCRLGTAFGRGRPRLRARFGCMCCG